MTLQDLVREIELEAQEGRIGVSKRIEFFDQGTKIGIKRSEIDKLIDGAIKKAKEAPKNPNKEDVIPPSIAGKSDFSASIPEVEVKKTIDPPIVEDKQEPKTNNPSDPSNEVQHDIDDSQQSENVEESEVFFEENEEIEYDDFLFEEDIETADQEEVVKDQDDDFSIHDKEESKRKLEDILNTIKSERKTDNPFKEFVGEDPMDKVKDATGKYIEKQPIDGSMLILIAGIASIVIGGFGFFGAISGVFGLSYVSTAEKKVKDVGPNKFTDASLTQLKVGKILCYVGIGLAALKIIGRF